MKLTEIRIAGFGGQGVILAANIIGKAMAIFGGGYATLTQNYGPEARGGACSAQLVLSDEPILYPYTTRPDVLVVMSQEAFARFAPDMNPSGMLLVEEELVALTELPPAVQVFAIPATRIAEELGKKMVLNVVMVGFFAARTGLLPKEAYLKAVADSVPSNAKEVNLQAFERGYSYGEQLPERAETLLTEQALVE